MTPDCAALARCYPSALPNKQRLVETTRERGGADGENRPAERQRQVGVGYRRRSRHAAVVCVARRSRPPRAALRLRPRPVRRLHGSHRRQGGALVPDAAFVGDGKAEGRHPGRPCPRQEAASRAAGFHRRAGGAVRLLHQRHDHGVGRLPRQDQEPERGRHQAGAGQQPLSLRDACPHRARGQARGDDGVREGTMNHMPSRRAMLQGGGALVVAFSFAGPIRQALAQGAAAGKPLALTEVDSFLSIDPKGAVTCYSGKVDLGTGVTTALRQIVAEELDVPLDRVELVTGDTSLTPDQGTTWGSLTIQIGGMQIRNAAATAKDALLGEAAQRLGVKKEDLSVADGVISDGAKRVTYGELIGGKQFSLKLDHQKPAKAKDPKDYKVVGKPVPRVDIPDKVTGKFTYMQDFRVPGMLHGRVVRPPALGAKLESVDEGSVKGIPGIVKVVRDGDFLGIVAETEWAAIKGARDIKATWSRAENLPDAARLWEHVRTSKVAKDEVTSSTGNVGAAFAEVGAKTIKASYDFAIHTHGSIGPSCAVAEFKDGKLVSWSASQATHGLRKQLATMFRMSPDDVRCIYVEGSGCYGRNGHEDAAADAALLARAAGRPVRVQWSRADEHGWDPKGPPTLIDIRASVDRAGNVTGWDSEFFIPQQTAGGFNVPLVAATLSGMPADAHVAPGNIFQNSAIPYRFANVRTV